MSVLRGLKRPRNDEHIITLNSYLTLYEQLTTPKNIQI
jgi:hypothetical protein